VTFRGIIFDLNGVLLWDAVLHMRAWQAVASDLRGYDMTEEEALVHMHGRRNADILTYLVGRPVEGQELADLARHKESLYRRLCLDNPQLFVLSPGARELLEALAEQGIPRTIATSAERTNLDFFTAHLGLEQWFDSTKIVYDDGLRPGKPAPDMYLAAAHKIRLAPEECVVVEDAISGLHAAHAAGIGHIMGLGPVDVHSKLLGCAGVASVIENLTQFPREILSGLR
jgi:HAD superfamily hydrolase (TIGR01509 family)